MDKVIAEPAGTWCKIPEGVAMEVRRLESSGPETEEQEALGWKNETMRITEGSCVSETDNYVRVSLAELQRMTPEEQGQYRAREDAFLRRQAAERYEDREWAVQLAQNLHGLPWPRAKAILAMAQAFLEETLAVDLRRADLPQVIGRFVGPSNEIG